MRPREGSDALREYAEHRRQLGESVHRGVEGELSCDMSRRAVVDFYDRMLGGDTSEFMMTNVRP